MVNCCSVNHTIQILITCLKASIGFYDLNLRWVSSNLFKIYQNLKKLGNLVQVNNKDPITILILNAILSLLSLLANLYFDQGFLLFDTEHFNAGWDVS